MYYPAQNNVFRFLNLDLNNIKYIIVGMDPYPHDYKINGISYPVANGRSFEPANFNDWCEITNYTSIINILKVIYFIENNKLSDISLIRKEICNGNFNILNPHNLFDYLEEQGVLFLNYALTVEPHKPGSHISLWENFSKMLVNYIDINYKVTWVLLGKNAQALTDIISKNEIICDSHPRMQSFCSDNKSLVLMKDIDFTGKKRH